jgi:putative ABC transport system ATP-binding protein
VAVIGSNGAGKSTFLNAISGDLLVDTGRSKSTADVTRKPAWDRAGWWRACSRTRWPAPARR